MKIYKTKKLLKNILVHTYFIFYLQGQDSVEVIEIPNMRPEQPKRKKNSKILPRVKKSVKKLTMQKAKDRRMAGKNQNRNKKMKKKGRN